MLCFLGVGNCWVTKVNQLEILLQCSIRLAWSKALVAWFWPSLVKNQQSGAMSVLQLFKI
jgi:hypothetical protein